MKPALNALQAVTPAKPVTSSKGVLEEHAGAKSGFTQLLKNQMQATQSRQLSQRAELATAQQRQLDRSREASKANQRAANGEKNASAQNTSKEKHHASEKSTEAVTSSAVAENTNIARLPTTLEANLPSSLSADMTQKDAPLDVGDETVALHRDATMQTPIPTVLALNHPATLEKLNGFSQTLALKANQAERVTLEQQRLINHGDITQDGLNAAEIIKTLPTNASLNPFEANHPAVLNASVNNKGMPSAFLQTLQAVDAQTAQIEKSLLQVNTMQPNAGLVDASVTTMKGFISNVGTDMQLVHTPFGQSGWHQEVQQKVVWMTSGGMEAATLTLNPPELGPLKVVIQVHNQKADALFISDNPEVRLALKENIEQLREAMRGNAISLGEANVNADGQQHFGQQLPHTSEPAHTDTTARDFTSEIDANPPRNVVVHDGIVNTYA